MKVAIMCPEDTAVEAVRQLLSPWHVEYAFPEKADVVIAYKTMGGVGKATVLVPSKKVEFLRWFKEMDLRVVEMGGRKLRVPATDKVALTLMPQTIRQSNVRADDDPSLGMWLDGTTFMLSVDVIEEYALKLGEMLNPRVSSLYKFLTGFPIPYTWAHSGFRNLFFRMGKRSCVDSFLDFLTLDALRHLLVSGIQEVTGRRLYRRTWWGHRYVCCITHDVETVVGLRKALALKRLEERYDVPSAWFLPTERYKLDSEVILELANHGEVGAHDTRHDGKLIRLSRERVFRRLCEAKWTLERILGRRVVGFRAPLLQHSDVIFGCLGEVGYIYDSSVPSWEPRHPSCMGPYGIGSVYPIDMGGILEVPISVPQDHQMIQVLGMNAKQTVEKWLDMIEAIKELGGICTILVHPDYGFTSPEGAVVYEELLNVISMDDQALITVPSHIAK